MSEWIKCSERMPEHGDVVQVWFYPYGHATSRTGMLYEDKWLIFGAFESDADTVTHWMPLPEPPND